MGNHAVGRAMEIAAKIFWLVNGDEPVTKDTALKALDAMGEDWRGADAEFDDATLPDEPLGRLLAIAFEWTEDDAAVEKAREEADTDDFMMLWYEKVETPFHDRYGFC